MFLVGKCDVRLIAIITIGETKKRKEGIAKLYIWGRAWRHASKASRQLLMIKSRLK
jgi:hypothetical protein